MIINARERFELAKRRAMFDRLCKLSDQLDDKIMRDPFPLLDAAYDEINRLRKAIEDIKRAIPSSFVQLRTLIKCALVAHYIADSVTCRLNTVKDDILNFYGL